MIFRLSRQQHILAHHPRPSMQPTCALLVLALTPTTHGWAIATTATTRRILRATPIRAAAEADALRLTALWLPTKLGFGVNYHRGAPLSRYFFHPRESALEQLKIELDSKNWLSASERSDILTEASGRTCKHYPSGRTDPVGVRPLSHARLCRRVGRRPICSTTGRPKVATGRGRLTSSRAYGSRLRTTARTSCKMRCRPRSCCPNRSAGVSVP